MEHNQHRGGETDQNNEQGAELRPVPRVYVASLADYVDGRLHGRWLDVTGDVDELNEGVKAMLAASPMLGAEEWAIHDYEGFGPARLDEYESLATVARLAEGIRKHGEAFAHWAGLQGRLEDAEPEEFEQVCLGHWETVEAFAESLWEGYGYQEILEQTIPENLHTYVRFDAQAYGRDLQLGGDIIASDGDDGVYVFGAP